MTFANYRQKYKELIAIAFNELLSSNRIQNIINKLSLNEYEFLIAKEEHAKEAIQLLAHEYWKQNPIAKVFGTEERAYIVHYDTSKPRIDAGRFFIAIDKKYNKIVATVACPDFYDSGDLINVIKSRQAPQEQIHLFEILGLTKYHDELEDIAGNKYGKLFCGTAMCKNSNIKTKSFLAIFLGYLAVSTMIKCGYNVWYGESTHKAVTKQTQLVKPIILHECDYSNHTFKDNTPMTYYWDKLKKNENYTEAMIDELKENCKLCIVLYKKDMHYAAMEHLWNNIMIAPGSKQLKKKKLSKL